MFASKMPCTFLIDTDTASDDAVALIMALRSKQIRVAAITVVAGNVSVSQAVNNALYCTEICDSNVPVFPGAATPLLRELTTADWFHGKDGLGDHAYAPVKRRAESMHAADAIIETIRANPGIEIVTLGPLTNLALALSRESSLAKSVARCVMMGGNPCCEGNVTPAAEFNIWVDPEAARIVFHSGLNIEMVGWHLCRGQAALSHQDINHVLALKTPLAEFAIRCNSVAQDAYFKQTGERGISLPDPVAMAIAIDPKLCTSSSQHHVEIESASQLTRGMTVVDRLNVTADTRNRAGWSQAHARQPNKIHICWTLDIPAWKAALYSSLAG
jgi:purine nucleosidase